ncbi:neuropeptide F receptor [Loa loa]|uniref:Neuropeptide F receptor n=1 Tax=Loa loa TaxID=7209 RepID=A0A1S0U408_LOALO|nr:neuropeptide F receptor [Loa loa]EFO24548.2 neuropeptide F receptor [Loa loa]
MPALIFAESGSRSNWSDINCDEFDEIYNIQNSFLWQHRGESYVLLLYGLVCVFGTLANLFVLIAFLRTSHIRNLRNYFIANLAVSDLLLCVVTAPVTVYLTKNLFWPFGSFACQTLASVQAINMFVSCMTLVLIAMDRFLLTLCPVKWKLAATAPIMCYFIVWLTSILISTPYFFAVTAENVMLEPWNQPYTDVMLHICRRKRPQTCIEKAWHRLPFSRRTYTLSVLAIQYLLPLTALVFSYSQIGSAIRKRVKASTTIDQQRRQLMIQRNRKALLLLLLLVLVYAIAWFPMNAYNVLNVLEVIEFSQYRYLFCHLVGMTSACINPVLYALINDNFRAAFISVLRPVIRPCTTYSSVPINQQNTYTFSFNEHQLFKHQEVLAKVSCIKQYESLGRHGQSLNQISYR